MIRVDIIGRIIILACMIIWIWNVIMEDGDA